MTRYTDNILSGRDALTSADASKSQVGLKRTYFVSAGAGVNVTVSGVFPVGAQNVNAAVYVVQPGAATTNDNIILYANGNAATGSKLLSFLAIGSAANQRYAPTSYITSACVFIPPAAAGAATYSGEVPFQVIVSSVSTASYSIEITFDRGNSTTLGSTN